MESKNLLEALERMLALKNQTPSTPSGPSIPSVPSIAIMPGSSSHTASVPNSVATKRPRATGHSVPAKKPRLERTVRTSIGNTFASIEIPVDNDTDLLEFLARVKDEIGGLIVAQLDERGALKFLLTVKTKLSRTSTGGIEQITTPYFCSIPVIILQSTDIGE